MGELNYQCTKCERVRTGEGLVDTLAPGVKLGPCVGCGGRKATFRVVDKAVDRQRGEAGKESGMRLAETAEAINSEWVERADKELRSLALSGERFTAETLTGRVGMPSHPKAVGARFNAAARKGMIRKVGFTRANRAAAHARDLAVWQGVTE